MQDQVIQIDLKYENALFSKGISTYDIDCVF